MSELRNELMNSINVMPNSQSQFVNGAESGRWADTRDHPMFGDEFKKELDQLAFDMDVQ